MTAILSIFPLLLAILFLTAGNIQLAWAVEIAKRRQSNVWNSAMPEFGGGLLFLAMSVIAAAVYGGVL